MKTETERGVLDILCVGETSAGKSSFLRRYTGDACDQELYKIFLKRVGQHKLVYFHELEEEEELYMEKKYDAILFFVDFVSNWQAADNLIKWLDLQSRHTGTNIFKIPVRVIVSRVTHNRNFSKWKKALSHELASLLDRSQILYDGADIDQLLASFYE